MVRAKITLAMLAELHLVAAALGALAVACGGDGGPGATDAAAIDAGIDARRFDTPTVIGRLPCQARELRYLGGYYYWRDGQDLRRSPPGVVAPQRVVAFPDTRYTADGDDVYWVDGPNSQIMHSEVGGGTTMLVQVQRGDVVRGMAADADHLYIAVSRSLLGPSNIFDTSLAAPVTSRIIHTVNNGALGVWGLSSGRVLYAIDRETDQPPSFVSTTWGWITGAGQGHTFTPTTGLGAAAAIDGNAILVLSDGGIAEGTFAGAALRFRADPPGAGSRDLAVTPDDLWAAGSQGVVRAARAGGAFTTIDAAGYTVAAGGGYVEWLRGDPNCGASQTVDVVALSADP